MLAIPSLSISGYGETKEKAVTMMRFCVQDTARYFLEMPDDEIRAELTSLGWAAEKNSPKELSKSTPDETTEFDTMHVEGDKIERFNLALAA